MKRLLAAVVTALLVTSSVALAEGAWSWYTDAKGEASGSLASLTALGVSDARGGDSLYPGQSMPLRVSIKNENAVPLTLVSVEIGDLKSGDGSCDASLADSRLRFDRTPDIAVQPGANEVVLGSVRLPKLLAQSCQGKDVSAEVSVRAAYGVAG
jgi:hypothetical protein